MNILIATDTIELAVYLHGALHFSDFQPDTAATIDKAIDLARDGRYHQLIVDMRMEGGGYELLRALRREHRVETPALMVINGYRIDPRVGDVLLPEDDHTSLPLRQESVQTFLQKRARRLGMSLIEPIELNRLRLDEETSRLHIKPDQIIELSPLEFGLLRQLARSPIRTLGSDVLIEWLYDRPLPPVRRRWDSPAARQLAMEWDPARELRRLSARLAMKLAGLLWPELPRSEQRLRSRELIIQVPGVGYRLNAK